MTILKQDHAASAGAIIQVVTHMMQGIFTQVTSLAFTSMGIGPFLTLLGGLAFAASALGLFVGHRYLSRAAAAAAAGGGRELAMA